jgi:colicin import membrane protein
MQRAHAIPGHGMSASSPQAFILSATLHATVAALVLWLAHVMSRREPPPIIFELVAGEGDNFAATEAPALGEDGPSVELPTPPVIRPAPLPPQPVAPPLITPAPPPPKIAPQPVPPKRVTAPKRQEQEKKTLTKEEFDRLHKKKSVPPPKVAPPKIAKIDAAGISKGVIGGSTNNKVGGAGGRALIADNGTELEKYYALFKQRVKQQFQQPTGLSDTLVATASVRSNANGTLTGARITKSSGSAEFDQAVLSAIQGTRMPARPDGKSETIQFPFTMRERDEP